MLSKCPGEKLSLSLRRNTRKPNQHNAGVGQALTENKFAKILVCCQQDCISLTTLTEHYFIVDSRIEFSYKLDAVSIGAEAFDDLSIYAFFRDDIQLAFSKG